MSEYDKPNLSPVKLKRLLWSDTTHKAHSRWTEFNCLYQMITHSSLASLQSMYRHAALGEGTEILLAYVLAHWCPTFWALVLDTISHPWPKPHMPDWAQYLTLSQSHTCWIKPPTHHMCWMGPTTLFSTLHVPYHACHPTPGLGLNHAHSRLSLPPQPCVLLIGPTTPAPATHAASVLLPCPQPCTCQIGPTTQALAPQAAGRSHAWGHAI